MLLTRNGLVDRLTIICAIRDEAGNLAVDLLEQSGNFAYVVCIILGQSVRNDFTGVPRRSRDGACATIGDGGRIFPRSTRLSRLSAVAGTQLGPTSLAAGLR